MRHHSRFVRNSGFSLVEVVVAATVTLLLSLTVAESLRHSVDMNNRIVRSDTATQREQQMLGDVRQVALSAIRVYGNRDIGNSLFAALGNASDPEVPFTRLPCWHQEGTLRRDMVGEQYTGNALMFLVEEEPLDVSQTGFTRRVDRVRFVAFYLRSRGGGARQRLDLVRFVSKPYVTYKSVVGISDPITRSWLVGELHTRGHRRLFKVDEPRSSAFYPISSSGATSSTPVSNAIIAQAPTIRTRSLFRDHKMAVAPNHDEFKVPGFGQVDDTLPGFPGGFEVKLVGAYGAQRIAARLVVVHGSNTTDRAVTRVTRMFTIGAR